MNFPVIDLHCDTVLALLGDDMNQAGSLRKNRFHIDLERASRLGGYAQCFACFTTPFMEEYHHVSPVVAFEREIATLQREMDRNKDLISIAYSPKEIEENRKNGKMSAILTLEGTAGIGYDPELLSSLWLIGFRISSLGWNEKNPLTGSHETGGGLTDQGRAYVEEAQRLGMLIDVSHISDEGFWDIMDITRAPIVATHSNSRAVWNNSRNLTDDMFRAIAQTGGVAGYNVCAEFTGEKPTLDTMCDHILHFMELDPSGKHIALGGDLDGITEMPAGFEGVQSWPALARRLLERGLGEETVGNIFWNNAIGVMECAVCDHAKEPGRLHCPACPAGKPGAGRRTVRAVPGACFLPGGNRRSEREVLSPVCRRGAEPAVQYEADPVGCGILRRALSRPTDESAPADYCRGMLAQSGMDV